MKIHKKKVHKQYNDGEFQCDERERESRFIESDMADAKISQFTE